LNSGWGKHAEKPDSEELEIVAYNENDDLFIQQAMAGNFSKINQVPINDTHYLRKTKYDRRNVALDLTRTYLAAGAQVPAYGRLQMYEILKLYGDRMLYNDTDSAHVVYDPEKFNMTPGHLLGQWEEENRFLFAYSDLTSFMLWLQSLMVKSTWMVKLISKSRDSLWVTLILK
jgi:hypothetical protein